MNVVIVNDFATINGGAARVALSSAIGLSSRGLNVHFLTAVGPVDESLGPNSVQVHLLDRKPYSESRAVVSGLWDRDAKQALDELLAKVGANDTIVHVHSYREGLSSSVLQSAFEAGVPLVFTCHEYGLACPYADFFDHRQNAICERKPLSASCLFAHCNRKGYDKKLWTFARAAIQKRRAHLPTRVSDVIFVSEFSRKILEPYMGAQARRHIIRNPVEAVPGQKRQLKPDSPFIFVGLLTPGKDPVLAAQAAAAAGVPITFVGDGELRDEVLRANPQARISGWLPSDKVREEMLQARAIVLPARWYETQGLVVQEAAAVGVPAIVSRTCAASEFIEDGINGLLIDAGSVDQLSAAFNKLKDDATACDMGDATYARFWADPPTTDKHVDALLRVYEGALSNRA